MRILCESGWFPCPGAVKTAICDGGGGGRFCEGKGNTSFVQSFLPFKDYIELLKKNEYILKASDLKEPREEKDGGGSWMLGGVSWGSEGSVSVVQRLATLGTLKIWGSSINLQILFSHFPIFSHLICVCVGLWEYKLAKNELCVLYIVERETGEVQSCYLSKGSMCEKHISYRITGKHHRLDWR